MGNRGDASDEEMDGGEWEGCDGRIVGNGGDVGGEEMDGGEWERCDGRIVGNAMLVVRKWMEERCDSRNQSFFMFLTFWEVDDGF